MPLNLHYSMPFPMLAMPDFDMLPHKLGDRSRAYLMYHAPCPSRTCHAVRVHRTFGRDREGAASLPVASCRARPTHVGVRSALLVRADRISDAAGGAGASGPGATAGPSGLDTRTVRSVSIFSKSFLVSSLSPHLGSTKSHGCEGRCLGSHVGRPDTAMQQLG